MTKFEPVALMMAQEILALHFQLVMAGYESAASLYCDFLRVAIRQGNNSIYDNSAILSSDADLLELWRMKEKMQELLKEGGPK